MCRLESHATASSLHPTRASRPAVMTRHQRRWAHSLSQVRFLSRNSDSGSRSSHRLLAVWGNGDHGRLGLGPQPGKGRAQGSFREGEEDAATTGWWRGMFMEGGGEAGGEDNGCKSVNVPTVCEALRGHDVSQVACGGAHTLVLTGESVRGGGGERGERGGPVSDCTAGKFSRQLLHMHRGDQQCKGMK